MSSRSAPAWSGQVSFVPVSLVPVSLVPASFGFVSLAPLANHGAVPRSPAPRERASHRASAIRCAGAGASHLRARRAAHSLLGSSQPRRVAMESARREHGQRARERDDGGDDAARDRGDPPQPGVARPDRAAMASSAGLRSAERRDRHSTEPPLGTHPAGRAAAVQGNEPHRERFSRR